MTMTNVPECRGVSKISRGLVAPKDDVRKANALVVKSALGLKRGTISLSSVSMLMLTKGRTLHDMGTYHWLTYDSAHTVDLSRTLMSAS